MSTVPSKAKAVVIGAGIVGNSIAYHLARLGWREIVQIDKGPLPNPGGSTGHASNFIFPVDTHRQTVAQPCEKPSNVTGMYLNDFNSVSQTASKY